MKKLKGFAIICVTLLLGVLCKQFTDQLNFPIPEAIYGMIFLLIALLVGIVKLDQIQEITDILLENLAFLFVIPGVALVDQLDTLGSSLIPIILIVVISAIITMSVTAKVVEALQKATKKGGK